jgi:predicted GTPase
VSLGITLRRYGPETLLVFAVALPWLVLLVLGMLWLWQGAHVWAWAIAAAALNLLAWPLARLVRRRANAQASEALGEIPEPDREWNESERQAWSEVLTMADATAPFSFTEIDPLFARARDTVEAVARRLHPRAHSAWAEFTLPEILLLTERLCRDVRREALRSIPGIRMIRLSHLLWVRRQNERFGEAARVGFGLWRIIRAMRDPLQAVGSETSGSFGERIAIVLSYRMRAEATHMLVREVGRAAINLYAGRLALSETEVRDAQERDAAAASEAPAMPVRIVLAGQVNSGKSSLVNALAEESHCATGPVPTTARVAEFRLVHDGRPAVSLVDLPGLDAGTTTPELLKEAGRADLILWVAAATQPARDPDRRALDELRTWARAQLSRRAPPVLLALTHVDELRPANEWTPPYDVATPAVAKARAIRAAMTVAAGALDLPADSVVPIAMPPGRAPYNLDALWARIAGELDEAKLVQLDRLRIGRASLSLSELANQLGHAGRFIIRSVIKA